MRIIKIESFDGQSGVEVNRAKHYNYSGYKISTDKKEFTIAIDNSSQCCESWGHITSEENFTKFIGAEILNYRCVNKADYRDCNLTKKDAGEYVDVYDCAFIDFQTDKGALQFAVYNNHNGYYGHDIIIIEK